MARQTSKMRAIPLRMRPDLVVREQRSVAKQAWIVKDPIALRYFTFSSQEFAILEMLDGTRSLEEIAWEFEDRFPPHRLTLPHLQSFLANLHENGLLVAAGDDQAKRLLERDSRLRRRERMQAWTNWLAIRFRGVDPDRLLSWVYPKLRWCFSPWFLAACALCIVGATSLVFVHADEVRRQLPSLEEFVSPTNILLMMLVFAAAKVIHEFGHALTCKHFGGECHEMGVMLLVFTPTLYCNVTDSWMLQNRWKRIAISAAGILVEILLAALAVVCWWYSQPGVFHTIALNMVIVCSVGTVFFNGNPLLRYDGYFILADLVDIPNLWQESRAALKSRLAKWFLAEDAVAKQPPNDRIALLTAYGLASVVYRVFIVVAILLFLHRALVPRGFGALVPILAAGILFSAVVVWFRSWRRFWSNPMALRQFNSGRLSLTAATAVLLLWAFIALPLPCRISAPAVIEPLGAHRVYVATPGTLQQAVNAGDAVRPGMALAQLVDPVLQREVLRLAGERRIAQIRVENLRARLSQDPDAAAQLQVAEEMLVDVEEQLRQRERDEKALTLSAPVAGVVLEGQEASAPPTDNPMLPTWTGTPLDRENANCHLERGTLFCLVGDPSKHEAVVFVDETDVQYVRVGQHVRMQFSVSPTAVFTGHVTDIAKRNLQTVPREFAAKQELATKVDHHGGRRPLRTSYSVRVALDEHEEQLLAGARGWAKISVEPQSLAERALRALRRTLTIEL